MEEDNFTETEAFRELINTNDFVIWPTSCMCGGHYAWFKKTGRGGYMCEGCICHTNPVEMLSDYIKEI